MVVAVYPGTFDPMTRGHEISFRRASNIRLSWWSARTQLNKRSFFSLESASVSREAARALSQRARGRLLGLLKDVRKNNARVMVRGLRGCRTSSTSSRWPGMNRYLLPDVETMFLTPSDQYQFISGTFVREIAVLGGDVSKFVFPSVERWLQEKIGKAE